MHAKRTPSMDRVVMFMTAIALAAAFFWRAEANAQHIKYQDANFVFFWLAGRMTLEGENPYDSAQWLAQHDANGIAWRPNSIFPYPLPLAPLLAPLGLLSLRSAYLAWQLLSEALIAISVLLLLRTTGRGRAPLFLGPLVLMLLFYGPVYLTLQVGALGAFTLLNLTCAILSLDARRPALAGALLALTILKPPQGLPILVLSTLWFIARREWKALLGMTAGAAGLLVLGLLVDPQWMAKFLSAGERVMARTLGFQSNAFGLAYQVCDGSIGCMWWLGGLIATAVLVLCSWFLWRQRDRLSPWEAFGLIIPCAFLSTVYLWSYDQLPYIIPIVWIITALGQGRWSYVASLSFLIILILASIAALGIFARTRSDLPGLGNTILVLGMLVVLMRQRLASSLLAAPVSPAP